MTVPVIVFPNALRLVLDLLRAHPATPAELNGKIVATLPNEFPAGTPYLQVNLITGGKRIVPRRLAQAKLDLKVYHPDLFTCSDLAGKVTAVALALEQQSTNEGGITRVEMAGDPFPNQDRDTGVECYVIPLEITYRPR